MRLARLFPGSTIFGLAAALLVPCGFSTAASPDLKLKEGDLVFQTSLSSQSEAIQRAMGSRWSHMGIVLEEEGRLFVLEAEGTVVRTPLPAWIARGKNGRFVARRLRDAERRLTPVVLARLREEGRRRLGKAYDPYFEWSDERIYCSELVWKIYRDAAGIELGSLAQMRSFRLEDPLVQAKLRERFGDRVPLDEPVISPAAVFEAPELVTVAER